MIDPDLIREAGLLAAGHNFVAGCDEVGRGALAGPVSVGIVVVDGACGPPPAGIRDSKALTARRREELAPAVRSWARAGAVGHAAPEEIDALGIVAALRVAARRALAALAETGIRPDVVLLDGVHDWLGADPVLGEPGDLPVPPPVTTVRGGDATCLSIAAASILAKVERDGLMADLDLRHPGYGWAGNKGYASAGHVAALTAQGVSPAHRRSWRLPGGPAEG